MSRGSGDKPGRTGRQITSDEAELWHQLTRSLQKTKLKPRVVAKSGSAAPAAAAVQDERPALPRRSSPRPAPVASAPSPPPPVRAAPGELDRRTLRQVAAGKVPIDATLDLHGLRQDTAYSRLRAFLVTSQATGHRMLLVITGKGGGARPLESDLRSSRQRGGERSDPTTARGVLRRSVPQWLEEPEFRVIVLSYASAGVRHGGEGALYIRLRKARDA